MLTAIAAALMGLGVPSASSASARELLPLTLPILSSSGLLLRAVASSGLPLVRLRLGSGELTAEVAHTLRQNADGLKLRDSLDRNSAMLFTFSLPRRVVFSMRDTQVPLSSAFIDEGGTVLETYAMTPGDPSPLASKSDRVRFVLEVNKGWFEEHGVTVGSRVSLID